MSTWLLIGAAAAGGALVAMLVRFTATALPPAMEDKWRAGARDVLGLPAVGAAPRPAANLRQPTFLYLGLEALSATTSAVVAWRFGPTPAMLAWLAFTWTGLTLAAIDLRARLLPDVFTLPLLWTGLLLSVTGLTGVTPGEAVVAAAGGYLLLSLAGWGGERAGGREHAIGAGDAKLMAAIGAWTGPGVALTVCAAALLGSLIVLMAARLSGRSTAPMGPLLVAAGWLAVVTGGWWGWTAVLVSR